MFKYLGMKYAHNALLYKPFYTANINLFKPISLVGFGDMCCSLNLMDRKSKYSSIKKKKLPSQYLK